MAFGDVLKALRLRRGFTQEDVAKGTQLSKSVISMYETGSSKPSFEVLEAIADFFNVDMNTLTDTKPVDAQPPNVDLPNISNIFPLKTKKGPLLGTIAAGTPLYAEENFDGYRESTEDIRADFCLKIKGDSMIGARINDGDIVFIRKQPDVENGEIAAVLIDGEATLKRVYKKNGSLVLQAENPKYAPIVCSAKTCDECIIMGKAVTFQSDVV